MAIYRGSITPGAGSTVAADASDIVNTPYKDVEAVTVQDAVNELQDEKVSLAGDTMTGTLNIAGASSNIELDGGYAEIGDPGFEAAGIDINGTVYTPKIRVNDIGTTNPAQMVLHRHSTTLQPLILGARANSETSSHTAVTTGQGLFSILGAGYTGSHYDLFGSIDIVADAGTISSTSSPGKILIKVTPDGSNTPATAITIDSSKNVTLVGDLVTSSAKNTFIKVESIGDYFPSLLIERTGGSTKTDRSYQLGIGSAGNFFINDITAGIAPFSIDISQNATFAGNVSLADDKRLYVGDNNEAALYHHASGYTVLSSSVGTLFIDNLGVSAETQFHNDDSSDVSKLTMILGGATPNCSFYGNGTLSFSTKASSTYRTINFASIPTSASGLASGDVWSNSGILTVV